MISHKSLFYQNIEKHYEVNKEAKKPWNYEEANQVIQDLLLAKKTRGRKTRRQYHLLRLYDTMEVRRKQVIIKKIRHGEKIVYIVPYEELFEVLYYTHIAIDHGSRDKMIVALRAKYQIPRPIITTFLQFCEFCRNKKHRKNIDSETKPVISNEFSRGQIKLLDYQFCNDGDYKWILNYEDHSTKFTCLRPLKSKESVEVATELVTIFLELGAPAILQSEDGCEFVKDVIIESKKLWPELKIICGKTQSISHVNVDESNHYIKKMIQEWMQDNKSTNWSFGCYFVQYKLNSSHHVITGITPYKGLFGRDPHIGLSCLNLPKETVEFLETEDDLIELILQLENNEQEIDDNDAVLNDELSEEYQNNCLTEDEQLEKTKEFINTDITFVDQQENETKAQYNCLTEYDQLENTKELLAINMTFMEQENETNAQKPNELKRKRAAEEIDPPDQKLPSLSIGDCVLLSTGKIGWKPSCIQNLICIIVDYQNGVYQLGSSLGTIKGWYTRFDVIAAEKQFITLEDVPDKIISIQEALSEVKLRDESTVI